MQVSKSTRDTVGAVEYRYYNSVPGWSNGTLEFHRLVQDAVVPGQSEVLEIGPGPEGKTSTLLASRARRVDGLDIDERARSNPALDRTVIYDGKEFPIDANTYDTVIADYVMEHVESPRLMLREIHRVLRPGGWFVFRTPNVYHYVSLISRFTPHRIHLLTAHWARGREADAIDPYPTFYRFNSSASVRKIARESALTVHSMRFVEKQPSYLKFNQWIYRCGVLYERTVNATDNLAQLRANLFCVLHKPS